DVWLEQPEVPTAPIDRNAIEPSPVGITNIDYDAKAQRQAIKYSNGVSTRYHYDPNTFRLIHLRTGHAGRELQDLHYTFDPAGNITHIRDDAHQEVFFANARVEASAKYRYDALFRLVEATGREHLGQAGAHPHSHNDAPRIGRVGIPHASDGEALGRYIERYLYDAVGNITSMRHIGTTPHNPGWTRNYTYNESSQLETGKVSNRLTSTTVGSNTPMPAVYSREGEGYDEHGNMLKMPHLAAMRWNELDQLQMTQRQAVNDGTGHGERTWYVYDGGGQRIRKVTERSDGRIKDERLYLGGFEVYREHRSQGDDLIRETLHIMDDTQRIALVETHTSGEETGVPRRQIRYQLANHLGSASLEIDEQARILSYEEYSPYGSTTYQAVRSQLQTPKRYRYTAMERDDESGLNYHSARYYAPWLGRWASADPVGLTRGTNLYNYAGGDPVNRIDPAGTDWEFCNPFADSECGIDSTADVVRDYVPEHAEFDYDVRVGVVKGARDTVVGLKDLAVGAFRLSPVGRVIDREQWERSSRTLRETVSTIADDPGVLWDAVKEPYVKAIDEGRPGEAVGRGVFEIVTALVGTKGADKLAKGSKVGAAADDVAAIVNKIDDVAPVGKADVATVGNKLGDVPTVTNRIGTSAGGGDDIVTLYKAPAQGRSTAAKEVVEGFDAAQYPGMGPFFSTEKGVARGYQFHYQNGLQEFNLPRTDYDALVKQGAVRVDALEKASVHAPASLLESFNRALKKGPPNRYNLE
ncbi:MAG: RHS repeat-associated core domain-containing protein, partial [Nannocystaceae bacterium]